jgi:hypothetical protein
MNESLINNLGNICTACVGSFKSFKKDDCFLFKVEHFLV